MWNYESMSEIKCFRILPYDTGVKEGCDIQVFKEVAGQGEWKIGFSEMEYEDHKKIVLCYRDAKSKAMSVVRKFADPVFTISVSFQPF